MFLLLFQNCNKEDPPCPCVHVERLCFEMDKKYTNTKLQLLLSPCVLIARDNMTVQIFFFFFFFGCLEYIRAMLQGNDHVNFVVVCTLKQKKLV
jgi:hypothetical protein